ncbi:MAG: Unknown protein [uncultured Sulfurovum sp.]|uniref:Peptidase M12B domain-containing protein n=1 Tax=uncultured Sulfurovum sp. TaxID=269237 RepID=A0A6S6SPD1_9BACT|nr:MAG: Unknown protein [uncultured Sulfurovum sp.]
MKSTLLKHTLSLSTLLLLSTSSLMAENSVTEIDTLVLYSQGAKDDSNGDIETKVNHLFTTTNKIYEDSGLNVTLNAVKIEKIEVEDTASTYDVLPNVRKDSEIQALRDSVGADEVVIYRSYANDGLCGLAYYNNGHQAYAYAHVTIDCGGYVTGHEVGHNMHLAHSAKQDPEAGYGRGHGVQDQFTTVMAYSQAYNGPKIYKFSDPALDCNGEPCGIEAGLDNEADAVKEILVQAPIIANFRERVIIDDKNDTEDDSNKPDNNSTDDNNNNDTSDLDTAKKAYEAQIVVVNDAKTELQALNTNIKTVRTNANAIYKTKSEELLTTFRAEKAAAKEVLTAELAKLRANYLTARTEKRAGTITAEQFKAIVAQITADKNSKKTAYKETVATKKADMNAKKTLLKEEKNASIAEAKATRTAFKTEVYLVEVQKLKALKKIYNDLLKANR